MHHSWILNTGSPHTHTHIHTWVQRDAYTHNPHLTRCTVSSIFNFRFILKHFVLSSTIPCYHELRGLLFALAIIMIMIKHEKWSESGEFDTEMIKEKQRKKKHWISNGRTKIVEEWSKGSGLAGIETRNSDFINEITFSDFQSGILRNIRKQKCFYKITNKVDVNGGPQYGFQFVQKTSN